jgi:mono/diheme cytochrome c family protein
MIVMDSQGQVRSERSVRRPHGLAGVLLLPALAVAALPAFATASPASVGRGQRLAETHCRSCHTIAGSKASPVTGAPPFAQLQQLNPGRSLDEIFADGMASGHPPMPSFAASSEQLQDLLDYIRSVQVAPPR